MKKKELDCFMSYLILFRTRFSIMINRLILILPMQNDLSKIIISSADYFLENH